MPKGIPIGFEMAEKKVNKQTNNQTNRHFPIYISRDKKICLQNVIECKDNYVKKGQDK